MSSKWRVHAETITTIQALIRFVRRLYSFPISYCSGLVTNSILTCWFFTIKDWGKKCFLHTIHTIKVCISYFRLCPGTSSPSTANLTVSCISEVPEATYETNRGRHEGCRVSSESPSRVWQGDEGVDGRNRREKCFNNKGSLIYPPGKPNIFFTKRKKMN